jgi:hypothetical protein
VEVYIFNGRERQLIGAKKFEKVFYNAEVIKSTVNDLAKNYVLSQSKLTGQNVNENVVDETVKNMVNQCYKSFLDDDYAIQLNNLLPILDVKCIGQ